MVTSGPKGLRCQVCPVAETCVLGPVVPSGVVSPPSAVSPAPFGGSAVSPGGTDQSTGGVWSVGAAVLGGGWGGSFVGACTQPPVLQGGRHRPPLAAGPLSSGLTFQAGAPRAGRRGGVTRRGPDTGVGRQDAQRMVPAGVRREGRA